MKVLVTGAGGFLGHHVVERLLQGGHEVRAIIRPSSPLPEWKGPVEIYRTDLRIPGAAMASFAEIDAILHVAAATSGSEDAQFASTVVGTENLLNAMAKTSVKRIIHVSSLVAYDWSHAIGVMDEHTPLRKDIYDMGAYTIAKVWQERIVAKFSAMHSWDLTIVRPGFIWGPQHTEIAGMGRLFGRVYLMFGPRTRLPLTHVTNCADCIVVALEKTASIGENFNVIDSDEVRVWQYVREHAARTKPYAWFVPIPYHLGLAAAHLSASISKVLFGKKGKLPSLLVPSRYESQFKPLRFSNSKLKQLLQWTPPLGLKDCLRGAYQR